MSVTVCFSGKRKAIKIEAQTLVQDVVREAASFFSVDAARCQLKHGRNVLAANQLFRFTNVANNAQIDLVVNEISAKVAAGLNPISKIALSIPNAGSVTRNFDSTLTLQEMLLVFVSEQILPPHIFSCKPELIYMRNSYTEDKLDTTTIASLGLAGQAARFLLKYDESIPIPHQDVESIAQPVTAVEATVSLNKAIKMDSAGSPRDDALGPSQSSAMQVELPAATAPLPVAPKESFLAPTSVPVSTATSESPEIAVGSIRASTNHESSIAMEVEQQMRQPHIVLADLLSSTFDAVSKPAVVTIAKYLCNILSNPDEPKYRTINTSNAVFAAKIATLPLAVEYLLSIGFAVAPANQGSNRGNAPGIANLMFPLAEDLELLRYALQQLNEAMDSLAVPVEERPTVRVVSRANTAVVAAAATAFDPFKSAITRAAPQPVRSEQKSSTELTLEKLQKRRLELEGSPSDVIRCTEVVFPGLNSSLVVVSAASTGLDSDAPAAVVGNEDETEYSATSVDKKLMVKSVMRAGATEDDTPLMTAAMRSLQKAQKEVVYSKTLIKIRFPDKMCLSGYFHPRHTIRDVFDWVIASLDSSSGAADVPFELFLSPPKRVFARDSNESLLELNLVPAAIVNLYWLADPPSNSMYFDSQLLITADSKLSTNSSSSSSSSVNNSANSSAFAFPTGQQLLDTATSTLASLTNSHSNSSSSQPKALSQTADSKGTTAKKGGGGLVPKWLKF